MLLTRTSGTGAVSRRTVCDREDGTTARATVSRTRGGSPASRSPTSTRRPQPDARSTGVEPPLTIVERTPAPSTPRTTPAPSRGTPMHSQRLASRHQHAGHVPPTVPSAAIQSSGGGEPGARSAPPAMVCRHIRSMTRSTTSSSRTSMGPSTRYPSSCRCIKTMTGWDVGRARTICSSTRATGSGSGVGAEPARHV